MRASELKSIMENLINSVGDCELDFSVDLFHFQDEINNTGFVSSPFAFVKLKWPSHFDTSISDKESFIVLEKAE